MCENGLFSFFAAPEWATDEEWHDLAGLEGSPWLLIHGFMGDGGDWLQVADYLFRAPALILSLPGHLGGGMPGPDLDLVGLADRIADSLASGAGLPGGRPVRRVRLAGYSMGGRLALTLAARHPEMVELLVLESASPGLRTDTERQARLLADFELADLLDELDGDDDGMRLFLEQWYTAPLWGGAAGMGGEAVLADLIERRVASACPAAWAQALRCFSVGLQPDLWPVLTRLPMPVHVIVGQLDAKYARIGQEMTAAAPAIQLHTVPDAGHNCRLGNLPYTRQVYAAIERGDAFTAR